MNERIRELLEQADINIDSFQFSGTPIKYIVDEPSLEKFAELIIRECAKVADIADENSCEWIGGNILTHFGVK
jgi:hypothetical protein